ncbi:hypothetical protein GCM10028805_36560 [Spirosoma harenae]
MKISLFVLFITLICYSHGTAQSQPTREDAEKFVLSKLIKYYKFEHQYTTPYSLSNAQFINYDIRINEGTLILKEMYKYFEVYTLTIIKKIDLRDFNQIIIEPEFIHIDTKTNNCSITKIETRDGRETKRPVEQSRSFFEIGINKNMTLEANLEQRLRNALNDLKRFYTSEDKY